MPTTTIFEAKTKLSEFIRMAQKGNEVIITSGRERTPVAKLVAIAPVKKKRLGLLEGTGLVLPKDFFDPLPEEELALWEGNDFDAVIQTGLSTESVTESSTQR